MKKLDMQGQPCPIPVITAKKELNSPECTQLTVIVDNFVAVQNLEKMANGMGYQFEHICVTEDIYHVTISKADGLTAPPPPLMIPSIPIATDGCTVLITSPQMGQGSAELGRILMKGFIFSLTALEIKPKAVIFLNGGVELVCQSNNVLDDLNTLQSQGTRIIACGTCLNYFGLTHSHSVGEIGDMYLISTHLSTATPLISL